MKPSAPPLPVGLRRPQKKGFSVNRKHHWTLNFLSSHPILSHRRMPSLLEYLSYNCNFMGILAGPTCSYNNYVAFIEGTCYQPRHQENANGKENGKCKQSEPSPKVPRCQGVGVGLGG